MTTTDALVRTRRRRPEWLVPAGLIALSLVPVLAGALRVATLAVGPEVTEENARFVTSPVPVIVHIAGSTVFLVLGALQFVPSLRRRRWHRMAGRIALPAGLLSALSALWMTLFYSMPAVNGPGLYVMRLVLATVMAGGLVVAFLAIRRGKVTLHSAWMTRAYAIGLGAGTQVLTFLPWALLVGTPPSQAVHTMLMGAGWAINLAVAEVIIRRRARGSGPLRRATAPSARTVADLS